MRRRYYLGCPMWSNKAWAGSFFTSDAKPADFLGQYSSVLSTVEGNTTFYGVPSAETVRKWRRSARPGFRFCFKFPRVISHDKGLIDAAEETRRFFETLEPLAEQSGPFFLQLPPNFDDLDALDSYLHGLPRDHHYAVELRGPNFYRGDDRERRVTDLLGALGMDRVVFDTRRLMALETGDPEIRDAQRRKPKTPLRTEPLGTHPFLRYVGYPEIEQDMATIAFWAGEVARWLEEGRTPYIFMHQAPDDDRAPELCRLFHETLRQSVPDLDPLPLFPFETEPPKEEQLSLF